MQGSKRVLSYVLGFAVGLLAVAPPLNYAIPVVVNSYWWLYGCVVAGFLGMYLLMTDLPLSLKILSAYLFVGCFLSMAPYVSFNAAILAIAALYCFIGFTKSDYKIITDIVTAAFLLQLIFVVFQLCTMDKLMNFDRQEPVVFGTVMQNMRFGSLIAIMTPLIVYKNKWFIIPIIAMAFLSESASFGLAIAAGMTVYFVLKYPKRGLIVASLGAVGAIVYCLFDFTSVSVAFTCGRIPVWGAIIRTWVMDTSHQFVLPLTGPVDWKSIFIGRGLDTFLPLFPIFKHDLNPFGQAHNCHLQFLWEIGLVGYGLLVAYFINLVRRVWSQPLLVAGLVCMSVNMFFAFPTRETQTMLMMICFIALCEQTARLIDDKGVEYARH